MEAAACLDKARRCGATLLTLLDCISQFVDDDSIKEMQSAVSPDFVYALNPPREAPNLNAGEVVSNQSAYEQELIAYRKAGDKSYREQIECLWTLQHWNEMKNACTKYIEKFPNDASLWSDRAAAWQNLHENPKAIADYKKAIEIATAQGDTQTEGNAHVHLGSIYDDNGNYRLAFDEWQTAKRLGVIFSVRATNGKTFSSP